MIALTVLISTLSKTIMAKRMIKKSELQQARRDALKEAGLIKLEVWPHKDDTKAIALIKALDKRHTVKKG